MPDKHLASMPAKYRTVPIRISLVFNWHQMPDQYVRGILVACQPSAELCLLNYKVALPDRDLPGMPQVYLRYTCGIYTYQFGTQLVSNVRPMPVWPRLVCLSGMKQCVAGTIMPDKHYTGSRIMFHFTRRVLHQLVNVKKMIRKSDEGGKKWKGREQTSKIWQM